MYIADFFQHFSLLLRLLTFKEVEMVWCGILFGIFYLINSGIAEVPEVLQDLQTEFYLPYSTTEDVDFSLSRPGGFGCYQW